MTTRWAWHGGGIAAARAHFGDHPAGWIDLSTGVNPNPWPGAEAVSIDWHRLPEEGELRVLEEAAAARFGTSPDHLCALPGTEIGLRLLGDFIAGPAFHRVPSYRTHGDMIGGSKPLEYMNIIGNQSFILANPNNPDGHLSDQPALLDLLAGRGADSWLIVDEAFADAMPDISMAGYVSDDRRLLIFRSFGKFFGLAGLRLGFLLGPRELMGRMRAKLGAWPVSAAAIAIGTAAYRDRAWIAETRLALARQASALDGVLDGAGLRAIGGCDLFRLVETPDAAALFERLARQGILTRPFDYAPDWLRFGLPRDASALARLETALRDG